MKCLSVYNDYGANDNFAIIIQSSILLLVEAGGLYSLYFASLQII